MLNKKFNLLCLSPSDINEHLAAIKDFASDCETIIELGVRIPISTFALMMGKPKTLTSVDLVNSISVGSVKDLFVSATTPEMSAMVAKDAVIPAGYGSRILSFPEDTLQAPIAFSDKDTIVAGTNLSGAGGGGGMSRDSAVMIVAAIERQTAALRAGLFQERGINTPIY